MGQCCGSPTQQDLVQKVDKRPLLDNDTLSNSGEVKIVMETAFSFVLVGDAKIGKSALLNRFAENRYVDKYEPTVGVEFKSKYVDVKGKKAKLQVWDTAGQTRFRTVTRTYYRSANAIFLVFDLTKHDSFKSLKEFLSDIRKANPTPELVLILIGTKSDDEAEKEVTSDEPKEWAAANQMQYYETSAKFNKNIDEPFIFATTKLFDKSPQ